MKKFFALLAGLALLLAAGSAMAIPISGTINFVGTMKAVGGTGLGDATGIHFVDAFVAGGNEGLYSVITPYTTPATFTDFTFSPSLLPSPVSPLWKVDFGGITYSFDLSSILIAEQNSTHLALDGAGILKATGFDDTPGTWLLTTQGSASTLSFSATSAVPEPGTILLLGGGLLGLAFYGRRRMKA